MIPKIKVFNSSFVGSGFSTRESILKPKSNFIPIFLKFFHLLFEIKSVF